MSVEQTNTSTKGVIVAGFGALAFIALIVTVIVLGGTMTEIGYAAALGVLTAGIVVGSYVLGRRRGQPHSHAVATATILLGVLYIIGLTYRFLVEFGA